MTAKEQISEWFDDGIKENAIFMIIRYDWFDHEDYPCYVKSYPDLYSHLHTNHDKIMEIYDLKMDKEFQLKEIRAFHIPKEMTSECASL